jgi:hypothetical protein
MQLTLSAVGSTFTALRRRALVAGALVATCGLVACGSDEKKTTTTTGTGTTTGGTTTAGTTTSAGTSSGTTTTGENPSCELSHSAELQPQSAGIAMTAADGATKTPMPYMLFVVNPNAGVATGTGTADANKVFAVSVFDYDYCDFAYDHGYSLWPINGFNAASFYLVDSSGGGTSLRSGDYTLGGTSQSVYIASSAGNFGSGVTKEAVGKAKGGGSCGATFPTLTAVTIHLDNSYAVGASRTGVTGTITATLSDSTTITGPFSSGNCTASISNEALAALPKPDPCACSLGSSTAAAGAATP